jgi:tetratricopeptide (TPR) repeat protein
MASTIILLNLLQKLKMKLNKFKSNILLNTTLRVSNPESGISYYYKYIIAFTLLLFSFQNGIANNATLDSANAAYQKNDFDKAIKLYESIIVKDKLESSELYFNLGNAYYKKNNIAYAVLNYERAKKLNPNDDDINYNLKLVNQKIEDKIDAAPQLFLSEWKNGVVDLMSERAWSIFCILLVIVTLVLFAIFVAARNNGFKKTGFFGGAIFLIIAIITFFMAQNKYNFTKYKHDAIVTSPSITVNGSPNEKGTKLFVIHEGTKLNILQAEGDWIEIKIANGNVGWIKNNSITAI